MNKVIYKIKMAAQRSLGRLLYINHTYIPIFVCSASGGGSSLIGSLLDQRFEIACYVAESPGILPPSSPLSIKAVNEYSCLKDFFEDMFIEESFSPTFIRDELIDLYRKRVLFPKWSDYVIDKAANTHLVRTKCFKNAFPDAKFILLYRNPVDIIEGMRRKWSLFYNSSLQDLCTFWSSMYETFLEDTKEFRTDVIGVSFERLLDDSETVINNIAAEFNLSPRRRVKKYVDKSDSFGKGLRNIEGGRIKISKKQRDIESSSFLNDKQASYVHKRLNPLYQSMLFEIGDSGIRLG